MAAWHDAYIGKPWAAVPSPPGSYNCGELLRAVHKDLFGFEADAIGVDASRLDDCVRAFDPGRFGLRHLRWGERPSEFDTVFFRRARYADHCGIAAMTADGLMVLHCLQSAGVVLESPMEALSRGFASLEWLRLEAGCQLSA